MDLNKPGRKLVSKGILVIQNISRHDAGKKPVTLFVWFQEIFSGDYVCVAENEEGIGSSQVIEIHVLCKHHLLKQPMLSISFNLLH